MESKRILFLRVLLGVLILLNMAFIFRFSSENGQVSTETSGKVAHAVAEATVRDFDRKPQEEQTEIVNHLQFPVRKLAHMTEFATLGGLIFLLLLTWRGKVLLRYGGAILAAALYALSDEFHQNFSAGRGPQLTDVLIDASGALLACSLILLVWFLVRLRAKHPRPKKIVTTFYRIPCPKLASPVRLAVAADLHGNPPERVLDAIRAAHPDMILIPGDLTDYESICSRPTACETFLRECAAVAPTFYSLGNHELGAYHRGNPFGKPRKREIPVDFSERVAKTGACLLRNRSVRCGEITVCGLDSGLDGRRNAPDARALEAFARESGVRVLLCHHPEYYVPYIRETEMELTVCGHAHGGHWRFFGRGVYAPCQGLFPKYTSGLLDGGRCVISRGLGDHTRIPRFHNPRELVIVELGGREPMEKN